MGGDIKLIPDQIPIGFIRRTGIACFMQKRPYIANAPTALAKMAGVRMAGRIAGWQ